MVNVRSEFTKIDIIPSPNETKKMKVINPIRNEERIEDWPVFKSPS